MELKLNLIQSSSEILSNVKVISGLSIKTCWAIFFGFDFVKTVIGIFH
jgi:hypothetical protein